MEFGAHLKTAGGAHKAAERAGEIGADALQIFTQSPRMWHHPDVDPDAAARFRAARTEHGIGTVTCHATYLINLGATDEDVYARSVEALRKTMLMAQAYEADGVVFHLGSHLGALVARPEFFDVYLELAVDFALPFRLSGASTVLRWACRSSESGST